jgi:outer membrane scaffolding protein for murein synthesis (MipA/OmpV family)
MHHPSLLLATLTLLALPALADEAKPARWEGAIGLVSQYGPNYFGAEDYRVRLGPAGFVRYGRITVSGSGGFTTRRDDDVERGVAASLIERDHLRLSLSARWTNGRRESNSDRLSGMGDIQGTVLARLRVLWTPEGPWHYALGVSTDLLGNGNGWIADVGVAREWQLAPQTKLHFGASLSVGGDTYMQSWYGVTPEQAARTGYAVYTPGNGLRDISLGLTVRHEFGPRWGGFLSTGLSTQLGAAADSPLVQQRTGWSVGSGLAWRF